MYKSNLRNKKERAGRQEKKRAVVYPEEGQEFAFVRDMLGNGRINAYCEDGQVRVGRIRGSMRKFKQKIIIQAGDIVLISKRDYEEGKVDVIHKYSLEEANQLHYEGEFPEKIAKAYQQKDDINIHRNNPDQDNYVVFANTEEPRGESSGSGTELGAEPVSCLGSEDSIDIDAI